MKIIGPIAAFVFLTFNFSPSAMSSQPVATDWLQAGYNAQRIGSTPDQPSRFVPGRMTWDPPIRHKWQYQAPEDSIRSTVQVITYGDKVFVGYLSGTMRALTKAEGTVAWEFKADSPIFCSAAVEPAGDGRPARLFFSTTMGSVYALEPDTGRQLWQFNIGQRFGGFQASPLLAEGTVFLGAKKGTMYALDQAAGAVVWSVEVGGPIYQSAAYGDGRVYVGVEQEYMLYAFDARTGAVRWKSPVWGRAMREHYPIVHAGRVIVKTGYGAIGAPPPPLPQQRPLIQAWEERLKDIRPARGRTRAHQILVAIREETWRELLTRRGKQPPPAPQLPGRQGPPAPVTGLTGDYGTPKLLLDAFLAELNEPAAMELFNTEILPKWQTTLQQFYAETGVSTGHHGGSQTVAVFDAATGAPCPAVIEHAVQQAEAFTDFGPPPVLWHDTLFVQPGNFLATVGGGSTFLGLWDAMKGAFVEARLGGLYNRSDEHVAFSMAGDLLLTWAYTEQYATVYDVKQRGPVGNLKLPAFADKHKQVLYPTGAPPTVTGNLILHQINPAYIDCWEAK